jgi:hypothetical protein
MVIPLILADASDYMNPSGGDLPVSRMARKSRLALVRLCRSSGGRCGTVEEREEWVPDRAQLTSVVHQIFRPSICTNFVWFGTTQDGPFLIPKQLLLHFLPRPFVFLDSRLKFLVCFVSGSLQLLLEFLLFFPRQIICLAADVL